MSDGDSATPGLPRPPDDGGDNPWLTRNPRPSLGAAPWERRGHPDSDTVEPAGQNGGHSAAVTVADLIAKVHGASSVPQELRRPRPTPPPETPSTEVIPAVPLALEDPDTEIIPVVAGYASEVPDLAALCEPDRVPPSRVGPEHSAEQPEPKPRRSHRKTVVAGRAAAAVIAVSALAMTGSAWQWQSSKNSMLNKVSALDPNSRDIVDPNAQFGDENFLIVGVDSRFGENGDMGMGTTSDADGSRSDTVILVNIPASRKRVVAVSFPRDLAITPMKCEAWNAQTGDYGPQYDDQSKTTGPDQVYTETKLNSAYAVGGPRCLVKVIQKLSGLSVNHFMAVDFAGFAKMVDALGGVEVCSTTPLEDYELGTVLANAGRQTIDGRTALQYVRARQVTTEYNGDYGRIKRQQLFLSSLLRSMISKEVFFSLSKLNNVVNLFIGDSYVDNITTKDLVNLGQSIQGVNAGRVTFITVPTTGQTDSDGNEPPRTDDMHTLFEAIINDDPLPEEKNPDNTPVPGTPESTATATPDANQTTAAPPPAAANAELVSAVTTSPADVTVRVSNSTGENGLAATAANELETHGFNVTTPDDYPGPLTATTVFFSPGNEQAAATVASSFTNPTVEQVTGMGDVVRVVLGKDFLSVAPPTPSGSSVQVHVVHGAGNQASTPTELPKDLSVTNAADTTCQ
jgi:LCP family protein required for cell wall assembly